MLLFWPEFIGTAASMNMDENVKFYLIYYKYKSPSLNSFANIRLTQKLCGILKLLSRYVTCTIVNF